MKDYDNLTHLSLNVRVYKKRWLILLVFSINSLANSMLFTCITSINLIISKYYGISPELTDWASNSFPFVFVFIALPFAYFMDSFGVRTLLLVGSSLNAICVCLHLAGTFRQQGIWFVLAGQFVAAFSVGAYLQVTTVASVWFPESEQAIATSIALACNIIGNSMGYLQPSYMVPDSENMDKIYKGLFEMNISHVAFLGMCLISTYLFFEEKPILPPSYAKAIVDNTNHPEQCVETPGFKTSLKTLITDKNFVIFSFVFGISFGLNNMFLICLNQMSTHITNSTFIGWIGFFGNISSFFGILMFAAILDKYKCYRKMTILLFSLQIVCWVLFSIVLLYLKTTVSLFLTYILLSFCNVPFMTVGLTYVTELTYPIPEIFSTALIMIFGSLCEVVFVLVFGKLIDEQLLFLMCTIVGGLYAVGFLLTFFIKENLKRSQIESQKSSIPSTSPKGV
ncbi:heme transporter FLVCR2-like [Clytia hemisphaerica]|uniref:heme transporter FLVCR2-like n=1 Tax=Clytia hemisphaerica TaxID=252671 RepID=UPI0034D39423